MQWLSESARSAAAATHDQLKIIAIGVKNMNRNDAEYKKKKKSWLAAKELWPPGSYQCEACGATTTAPELDHIDNTGMGGSPSRLLDESNWQILCRECHRQKTDNIKPPAKG